MRVFTSDIYRLRANDTFTARSFLRVILQGARTKRDPNLYSFPVGKQNGSITGSALFAYKLYWQSVLFVGYGDSREGVGEHSLEKFDRQFFLKLSYAFQR